MAQSVIYRKVFCHTGRFEVGEKIDLKEIERRAYLSYHQDGLVDIFIGLAFLVFGAPILYDAGMVAVGGIPPPYITAAVGGIIAVVPVMYAAVKKLVTIPRLGYVKFASQRRRKTRNVVLFLVVAGVLGNVAGVFAMIYRPFVIFLVENYMIVIGVVGGAIFSLAAYLSEIKRFYAYGAINLIAFASSRLLHAGLYQPMILLGAVITFSGAFLLYRFLRKYPKRTGEMLDDEPRNR